MTSKKRSPPAAIERIEALSGGASAVYGADAVAGAVNFIMRDDFEGLVLDLRTGSPQEGDNFEYRASALMGSGAGAAATDSRGGGKRRYRSRLASGAAVIGAGAAQR